MNQILVLAVHDKMILGLSEAIQKLWQIVDESSSTAREKTQAIALIMQFYEKRTKLYEVQGLFDELVRYKIELGETQQALTERQERFQKAMAESKLSEDEIESH
jgi:hypothetical protein